jgi:hypothetical protein
MLSYRAIAWLVLLAPLVIGAGCSSPASQPCTTCDAGNTDRSDGPSDPVADAPSPDTAPISDTETEAVVVDQALAFDQDRTEEAPVDQAQPSALDGLEARQADGPGGEAAGLSPVPEGEILLWSDFEQGTTDGWRTADWTDAGTEDPDWSVFLGNTSYVYSEGSLDNREWHIAFTGSAAVADQIVEARMRVVEFYEAAPSFGAALFARYDPHTDSGYFVALRGDGSVIIRKRLLGKNASWKSGASAGIVPGAWYTVRLEALGDTVHAFLDGNLVYSVVDSDPLATGTAALGSYGATIEVDRIFLAKP